jgi:hypothetical protein
MYEWDISREIATGLAVIDCESQLLGISAASIDKVCSVRTCQQPHICDYNRTCVACLNNTQRVQIRMNKTHGFNRPWWYCVCASCCILLVILVIIDAIVEASEHDDDRPPPSPQSGGGYGYGGYSQRSTDIEGTDTNYAWELIKIVVGFVLIAAVAYAAYRFCPGSRSL